VDRTAGQVGFCGCPDGALVAKTMIHHWEEPALAPNGHSGAVFFGGCTLKCKYCQNAAISGGPVGKRVDSGELRQMMEDLITQGAENIDLVTPTHFLPTILPSLEPKLSVPVVYNCGGYERVESLRALEGLVDIYLPDFKYADPALAKTLSNAEDYVNRVIPAITEMVRQVGPPQWEGERLKKGVIIRHLILPGQVENSLKVLDMIGQRFGKTVLVSLMRQYTPVNGLPAPLDRPVSEDEYQSVLSWMFLNDLDGFTQEAESAAESFIPEFQKKAEI
jgi:putative pyruvate formate lyase activating enzyme